MRGRMLQLLVMASLILGLVAAPAWAAKPPKDTGVAVPSSMASLGDSITRGFNACGWFYDCTSRSWSTGSGNGVNSHFERLRATDSTMQRAYNEARTGARVSELPGQASDAVARGAGYVTILIGANDACTSTEAGMTTVEAFTADFSSAMSTLDPDGRGVNVFVTSIPDIKRLWEVGKVSGSARYAWSTYNICQSMLDNPTSTDPADVDRRNRVRQRVVDYNTAMENACAQYTNCIYDDNVVFNYDFELSHLSGWDYFHPNTTGQNILAEQTWAVGFEWASAKGGGGKGGGKGGGPNK
jgi:lysophospholipase L1-like esterase